MSLVLVTLALMDEMTPKAEEAVRRPAFSAADEEVVELGPESRGRWLVRSRGSEHVFDLDARTYQRRPGAGRGAFRNDGHTVRLGRVERWPRVGESFFIWVDDHQYPDSLEHWHKSSTIACITPLLPEGTSETSTGPTG